MQKLLSVIFLTALFSAVTASQFSFTIYEKNYYGEGGEAAAVNTDVLKEAIVRSMLVAISRNQEETSGDLSLVRRVLAASDFTALSKIYNEYATKKVDFVSQQKLILTDMSPVFSAFSRLPSASEEEREPLIEFLLNKMVSGTPNDFALKEMASVTPIDEHPIDEQASFALKEMASVTPIDEHPSFALKEMASVTPIDEQAPSRTGVKMLDEPFEQAANVERVDTTMSVAKLALEDELTAEEAVEAVELRSVRGVGRGENQACKKDRCGSFLCNGGSCCCRADLECVGKGLTGLCKRVGA